MACGWASVMDQTNCQCLKTIKTNGPIVMQLAVTLLEDCFIIIIMTIIGWLHVIFLGGMLLALRLRTLITSEHHVVLLFRDCVIQIWTIGLGKTLDLFLQKI
jgi:hypothetical protein